MTGPGFRRYQPQGYHVPPQQRRDLGHPEPHAGEGDGLAVLHQRHEA